MLLVWKLEPRPLFDEIVPAEAGWTDQTKLSVLLDFLDTEIAGDFAVRDRLANPIGWKLKPLVVMQGAKATCCRPRPTPLPPPS